MTVHGPMLVATWSSSGPSYQSQVSRPVRPVGRGLMPILGGGIWRSAARQISPMLGTGGSAGGAEGLAVGVQRDAANVLTDDGAGEVLHERACTANPVARTRRRRPGERPATSTAGDPRVLVRRRPVRITSADSAGAAVLPRSDDADEERVAGYTTARLRVRIASFGERISWRDKPRANTAIAATRLIAGPLSQCLCCQPAIRQPPSLDASTYVQRLRDRFAQRVSADLIASAINDRFRSRALDERELTPHRAWHQRLRLI